MFRNIIYIDKHQCIKSLAEVIELDRNYREYTLFMKALADETRVKIFHMLSEGEICACKILEEFNITQPTLSYHMKILCDSGLINSRRDGVWMKYSINKNVLSSLMNLFNDIDRKVAE